MRADRMDDDLDYDRDYDRDHDRDAGMRTAAGGPDHEPDRGPV